MSSRDCNTCSNLLRRDGTSQKQRLFDELKTSYVNIDERSMTDLLKFAISYAEKVQFWDVFNRRSGDWTTFLENSQASVYTDIVYSSIDKYRASFDLHYDVEFSSPVITRDETIEIMEEVFNVAAQLDKWLSQLDASLTLYDELSNVVQRQAVPIIRTLIEYDKGAEQELRLVPAPEGTPLSTIDYSSLSDFWGINPGEGELNRIIFVGSTIQEKGTSAKRHFRVLFESILDVLEQLKTNAEDTFGELLDQYSQHEPYFALFLSFIQLFRYAQDHLNEFTDKHIDFYYRDVLRLSEKEAVPDQVHVLFELAKNVDQKQVVAGTELNAGEDEDGIDITFTTNDELVANKAKVAALKTLYLDRGKNTKYIQTIYSADQANTSDGKGKAFSDENYSWEPFGKSQIKDGVLIDNQTMETSRVGFAMASPEFRLGEGERTLRFSLILNQTEFANAFDTGGTFEEFLNVNDVEIDGVTVTNDYTGYGKLLSRWLSIRISGKEGWIMPDNLENGGYALVTVGDSLGAFNKILTFELTLSKEQDPVIAYDPDIHERNYKSSWPVMEILCDQAPLTYGSQPLLAYEFLKNLRIDRVKIDTEVKGVTNLKIANDSGSLNPAKPFLPFTANPQVGSNFYIGSEEVFSKRLTYLSIGLDWKGVPEEKLSDYYALYREQNPNAAACKSNSKSSCTQRIVQDNNHFTAQLKFLEDFSWKDLSHDNSSVPLYQSSNVALRQTVEVIAAPMFFLMSVYQIAGAIKKMSKSPIRRDINTNNFVNLFRTGEAIDNDPEGSGVSDTNKGADARLPRKIIVQSKENQVPFAAHKTSFDLLTVDESTDFYERDPSIKNLDEYTDGVKRGYIKLELVNDFFHAAYSRILTERALKQVKGVPNVPYTPELHKVALDYKSTFELSYKQSSGTPPAWEDRIEHFYHITPFGEVEVFPSMAEKNLTTDSEDIYYSDRLLPQLFKSAEEITNQGRKETKIDIDTGRSVEIILEETGEGALYIGIEDLKPPMNLSLLFQFKEGTEDNNLEVPGVSWSYLSKNQWVEFKTSEITSDDTKGFSKSGIIQFSVPEDATTDNELYGSDYHWIRASVSGNTESFSNLINVHTQAVKATYLENENNAYRLNHPIEADTISKFVNRDFEIKTLSQPYSSFGGRIKEQKSEYHARVAERLRHKQRGITIRDYEHLVLEEFPAIYKVKCINHTSRYSEYAPGNVSVIVIPYFKNQNERNPFELKVSKAKLGEIRSFLVKLNSPFVNLDVRNPKYESIKVRFGVEFHVGYDRTFYVDKLNEDIKKFISPWAFGKDEDIIFGGRINRSVILNFIEELKYVDYVTNFQMFHKEDENRSLVEKIVAEGTTASSVLVTALDHIIEEASCDPVAALDSGGDYSFDHTSHSESFN